MRLQPGEYNEPPREPRIGEKEVRVAQGAAGILATLMNIGGNYIVHNPEILSGIDFIHNATNFGEGISQAADGWLIGAMIVLSGRVALRQFQMLFSDNEDFQQHIRELFLSPESIATGVGVLSMFSDFLNHPPV